MGNWGYINLCIGAPFHPIYKDGFRGHLVKSSINPQPLKKSQQENIGLSAPACNSGIFSFALNALGLTIRQPKGVRVATYLYVALP